MLRSKLQKLVPFKKLRRRPEPMGNCAGSGETSRGRQEEKVSTTTGSVAADKNLYTHGELVLK